ncbi:CD3072 family TudS-related putative desulfidase [Neobacillus dielmonensis]|uniref:CD3072 family TudS-related putative desulfidase n=1 Tax=Neobacillus dielmonensis TaxID=1347369 RepID=UPI0005A827B7|nr:CD3072 family TudS-related putative desulfidase [Neobacillus dielmonensis]
MQRSKRILIVSHCILNQNTVIADEARAEGAIVSAVEWAMKQGYGLLQLPCPEFTFLGLNRPSMTYEQYNTPEYRKHCREILQPVLYQAEDYLKNDYEIAGILGIQSSPSCDPVRGIFMEELTSMFAEKGITLETLWYLPNTSEPVFKSDEHFVK